MMPPALDPQQILSGTGLTSDVDGSDARPFKWTKTADQNHRPDLPQLLTGLRTGSLIDECLGAEDDGECEVFGVVAAGFGGVDRDA